MPAERYGHMTSADPRNIHPVVIVGERTPLLRSYDAERGNGSIQPQQQQDGETTVIAQEISMTKLVLIMGTTWIGVFLGAVDSTIIATLSAPIASEFESLSIMSWLATAYLISNAACQPISGRLTDIFGRGPGLVFSNVLFAAGNLICGLAQSPGVLILGRVVAGIGGGGLMSIATFLGSDLIPLRKRGMVQGIGNICYGSGAMLGGIIGGFLNDHTKLGWRLAFLIMVPPSIVSAILVAILVRIPPKQSDKSYLSRIDFTGVFLIISALVLLLLGVNAGGNMVPWTHPLPLTTIPLSAVILVGFFWWESRAEQPIIPVKLMMVRTVISACLCNLFCTMVMMAFLFYLPLYLQVRGNTATTAGLKMLPSPVGVSIGSFGVGYIMTKTGKYMASAISCLVILIFGLVLFTFQTESSPAWITLVAIFFSGAGYGGMLTTTLLACIAAVEHSQQAVITSATYLYRSVGGTIGVTIAAAVYQNILNSHLWKRFGAEPNAAEVIQRIRDNLNELKHLPDGWESGVIRSFMEAFEGVWLTLLGLAVAGLISVSFMKQHKLHSTLSRE
ncbi:Multidrug resistance protein fnx1 [Cladobotryum mycophilum]|uniref:Multidrug resistance protein fnx1 n=1 Tax=Cladobotryum mycophilum TaxID=491253 RepID=A0ABR0SNZ5_9HYPO